MKMIIKKLLTNLKKQSTYNTFIQIGSNCGNDDFTDMCKQHKPKQIILVEPHTRYNESLNACYKEFNYILENTAIVTDENIDKVNFYFPDAEKTRGQHSTIVPMNDWNKTYIEYDIPATTISKLIKKHNLHDIDLLMIDTEGLDYMILNSIDLNTTKISNIVYESWKFPTENCYDSKHQDLCGTNGLSHINKKLKELNYIIYADDTDYYATLIQGT